MTYRLHYPAVAALLGLAVVVVLSCGEAGGAARLQAADAIAHSPFGLPFAAEATLLAPGALTSSDNDELFATFDPNEAAIYFVRRVPGGVYTIVTSTYHDGSWSAPQVVPFSGKYKDQAPFLSPDGSRLYFYSNRPRDGQGEAREDDDVWWVERTADGSWGAPQNPGPPLNTGESERHPTVDAVGNLYFWTRRPDSRGETDLYRAAPAGAGYGKPENLGDTLNTEAYEANPWISPAGDLLLFTSDGRPDGLGREDVYVSRPRPGGGWSTPRNLGPQVNSPEYDFAPRLTPDGRYLVFSSNRGTAGGEPGGHDLYYVSVDALEALR